jgi:4,4'-diapolycopenoate synthase
VAAYLDENGNGKLDHNLLGIPREPVGASNNPTGRFGPPRFSDCVFSLSEPSQTISIQLVEPK